LRTGQNNESTKEKIMKQVKRLILAAFLVLTLSAGAQAGDIGSPGVRQPVPGDIGSPGNPGTKPAAQITDPSAFATTNNLIDDTIDSAMLEIVLALVALI
jgi:hypothetical protein